MMRLDTPARRKSPLAQLQRRIAKDGAYTLEFMREVLLSNKSTGALAPSGRALAELVTRLAHLDKADVIVEFGPGTGVFTEQIVKTKRPESYFCAFEVNEKFVQATRKRCPEVEVVHDSAEKVCEHLSSRGHDGCDVIVSGLPWTRFPESLQDSILDATYAALRPGGRFITFAYASSPLVPNGRKFFKDKLNAKFDHVRKTPNIWNNFPPAVVFIAKKIKN